MFFKKPNKVEKKFVGTSNSITEERLLVGEDTNQRAASKPYCLAGTPTGEQ